MSEEKEAEMSQFVKGLAEEMSKLQPKVNSLHLIPRYDGRKESRVSIKEFIRAVKNCQILDGWTETEAVTVIKLCTSGPAATCLEHAEVKTVNQARQVLEERFAESLGLATIMTKISDQNQRLDEDCVSFVERLERLKRPCTKALEESGIQEVEAFLEKTLLATLKKGIRNDRIRSKLIEENPENLADAKTLLRTQEKLEKEFFGAEKEGSSKGTVGSLEGETLQKMIEKSIQEAFKKRSEEVAALEQNTKKREGKEKRRFNDKSKVKCYNCRKMGHYANDCRAPKRQDKKEGQRAPRAKEHQGAKTDQGKKREPPECYYCHKRGHFARDCYTKKRDEETKSREPKNGDTPLAVSQQSANGSQGTPEEEVWG